MTLESVKAGDQVMLVSSGFQVHIVRRFVVDKVTKQHVVVGNDKYRKIGGKRVGSGDWSREWLEVWDEVRFKESQRELRLIRMRNKLAQLIWTRVPDALIPKAYELLMSEVDTNG